MTDSDPTSEILAEAQRLAAADVWVDCPQAPGGKILVRARTIWQKAQFGSAPHVYPVTIVQSRYSGSYEGADWLCFPCYPGALSDHYCDWDGSDIECMLFWKKAHEEHWLIGYGDTPAAAYQDLIERCLAAAES
jgi:hypothetical protein